MPLSSTLMWLQMSAEDAALIEEMKAEWYWTMGGGIALVFVGFVLYRWWRHKPVTTMSATREEQERAQRQIADARLQGVLTLQIVLSQTAFKSIANQLPTSGDGLDAVIDIARQLRETRPHWLFAAARGTVLMDEETAAAESARVLDIFAERASSVDYREAGLVLLTLVARSPSDYCEVMPADMEGFEMALSLLFEVDSRGAASFQLQTSEVTQEMLSDIVPGLIAAS